MTVGYYRSIIWSKYQPVSRHLVFNRNYFGQNSLHLEASSVIQVKEGLSSITIGHNGSQTWNRIMPLPVRDGAREQSSCFQEDTASPNTATYPCTKKSSMLQDTTKDRGVLAVVGSSPCSYWIISWCAHSCWIIYLQLLDHLVVYLLLLDHQSSLLEVREVSTAETGLRLYQLEVRSLVTGYLSPQW